MDISVKLWYTYNIKYELPLYIGSLTMVWSSDAYELTTQAVGLSG